MLRFIACVCLYAAALLTVLRLVVPRFARGLSADSLVPGGGPVAVPGRLV